MNTSVEPLTPYEERLLAELTAVVAGRAEPAAVTAHRRPHRRRLVWLGATGTAAAGVATAVTAGLVGGTTVVPAYAVERDGNSVGITIHDPSRLAGLDRDLTGVGVPARLVPVSATCAEPQPRPDTGSPEREFMITLSKDGGIKVVLYGADSLGPGQRLYFGEISTTPRGMQLEISDQPRTCFPLPPAQR